ncbi:MAG: hypothetical protein AAB228_00185 [Nitrospirota bacterium]
MQKEAKIGAITVDKIIHIAEMFKGFKKQTKVSVLKELDGKYREAGLRIKKEGKTSTDLIRELRESR